MRKAAFAVLAFLAAGASDASAGDAAARRVIGFSADGAAFAMEEYGASDPGMGGGALHVYISIVDVAAGQPTDDSVDATLSDGGAPLLAPLRSLAARAAADALSTHKIGAPGRLIGVDASSRAGEMFHYFDVWAVEEKATASLAVEAPELGGKARLVVDYEAPPSVDGHRGSLEKPPPFTLALERPGGGRVALTRVLADPREGERRAFYKYAIAEAFLLPRKGKRPVLAAILEIFSEGGEGTSRNFIPVAVELPER